MAKTKRSARSNRRPVRKASAKTRRRTSSPKPARATTLTAYLAGLPADRREIIAAAREFIQRHLPLGYEEMMSAGMVAWAVPLARLPKTYNGQPLWYIALGAQKNYNAMYLMCAYGSPKLTELLKTSFKQAGKKLDMGKSCLRFKTLDDLELDAVGQVIASTPMEEYARMYEQTRGGN
jgi:hypothetical protein